jgi:hypothetical protein
MRYPENATGSTPARRWSTALEQRQQGVSKPRLRSSSCKNAGKQWLTPFKLWITAYVGRLKRERDDAVALIIAKQEAGARTPAPGTHSSVADQLTWRLAR